MMDIPPLPSKETIQQWNDQADRLCDLWHQQAAESNFPLHVVASAAIAFSLDFADDEETLRIAEAAFQIGLAERRKELLEQQPEFHQ